MNSEIKEEYIFDPKNVCRVCNTFKYWHKGNHKDLYLTQSCDKWTPSDNLQYLESLYDTKNKHN